MKYLALLRDSLVETLDRKSLYVVLVISLLFILVCASIGFNELDAAGALKHTVGNFNRVYRPGQDMQPITFKAAFEVKDVVTEEKKHKFTLEVAPVDEFHRTVLTWDAMTKGKLKKREDPVEGIEKDKVADPGFDLEERFLRTQFRLNMVPRVEIEKGPVKDGHRVFHVISSDTRSQTLEGSHEITMLFGAFSARLPTSLAFFLTGIEFLVASWIGGFFGVILAVIFTAGFVPGMLQKGTLDLILAKPVRRPVILLTKYIGGLFYVAIPAVFLIGGCWLVISWRSGFYNPGFLSSIGVLLAIFAVLYSFALLMGVLTRSTIATILLTIGLWFFSFAINQVHQVFQNPEITFTPPAILEESVEKVRLGLPRTTELGKVSEYYILKGNLGPELNLILDDNARRQIEPPGFLSLAVSSVGFIAIMLAMACWVFSRRDY